MLRTLNKNIGWNIDEKLYSHLKTRNICNMWREAEMLLLFAPEHK
jgi:hypothetical protein